MRIIIESVDDNTLYSEARTYSFKELGQEEYLKNWIVMFRDILFNLSFDYDTIYDAIPNNVEEIK